MTFTALFSIKDEKGKTSTTECNFPAATSLDDARLMAQEVAKLIDAQITGAIVRIGLVVQVDAPAGLNGSPAANSDVEEGARFQFRTVNGFYTAMRLPTFDEAKIVAGTTEVDLTDTDVTAFYTGMVAGIDLTGVGGSGTVSACDKRGEDIGALEFAKEQFLSSRG